MLNTEGLDLYALKVERQKSSELEKYNSILSWQTTNS